MYSLMHFQCLVFELHKITAMYRSKVIYNGVCMFHKNFHSFLKDLKKNKTKQIHKQKQKKTKLFYFVLPSYLHIYFALLSLHLYLFCITIIAFVLTIQYGVFCTWYGNKIKLERLPILLQKLFLLFHLISLKQWQTSQVNF